MSEEDRIVKTKTIEMVIGHVADEPPRYYVARRVRLRLTDTSPTGISLWMDAFAHDWTIGHHFSPGQLRDLGRMMVALADECDRVNGTKPAAAEPTP